jgi:hypothetical protein
MELGLGLEREPEGWLPHTPEGEGLMEFYEQTDRRRDLAQAREMTLLGRLWVPVPQPLALRLVVRSALLSALAYTAGHQEAAAGWLGLTPRVLCYQLASHDIPGATTGMLRKPRRRRES